MNNMIFYIIFITQLKNYCKLPQEFSQILTCMTKHMSIIGFKKDVIKLKYNHNDCTNSGDINHIMLGFDIQFIQLL